MKNLSSVLTTFFLLLSLLIFSAGNLHAEDYIEDDDDFEEEIIQDPLEGFNRGMFWFNDKLDKYFLEPVSDAYTYVTPKPVRRSVGNFFENLGYPIYLVSDLLQLKFSQAGVHTGRFLVNTTIGAVGLFDVAKDFGLERHEEDIGSAFGYWGIGTGPYLVLPFLGPSNLRDGLGRAVSGYLNPANVPTVYHTSLHTSAEYSITGGLRFIEIVNTRADLAEAIDTAKDASLDYYSFVKNSYAQRRESIIYDGMPPEDDFFDEEEEDWEDQ